MATVPPYGMRQTRSVRAPKSGSVDSLEEPHDVDAIDHCLNEAVRVERDTLNDQRGRNNVCVTPQ